MKQMLSLEAKIEILSSSPIFENVSPDIIRTVAGRTGQVDLKAGEVLFREGEPGDSVFLVAAGDIEIAKGGVVLAILRRGDMAGEMAALAGGVRNADAKAGTDCTMLFLKAKALRLLIQQAPDLAFGIFGMLARRLQKADEYVLAVAGGGKTILAALEVLDGPDAGRSFRMIGDRLDIGRASGSVIDDAAKCALHAPGNLDAERASFVVHSGNSFFLQAAVPSEPPLLNDHEIHGAVELSDGDVITSLGVRIRFRAGRQNDAH